jgi:hypothetical protein
MSSTTLAIAEDKIPAHILASMELGSRGNEHVGSEVQIPRIKLLQKMHNEVDKHHPKYVKGAEVGSFYNTLTGKIYGDSVYVISITFKPLFVVWKDRERAGGGLLGSYPTAQAAAEAVEETGRPADHVVTPSHQHMLLIKDPKTGDLESTPVLMDFSNTKMMASKAWNSQIGMKGGDRFAGLWEMKSVSASNDKGTWLNLDINFAGWAMEDDFKTAEELYKKYG